MAAQSKERTARFVDSRIEAVVRRVREVVHQVTGGDTFDVHLFGSWATGQARSRSDIDIAIHGPRSLSPIEMAQIREACERLPTLFTIDLVDMAQVSGEFREAVLRQVPTLEP